MVSGGTESDARVVSPGFGTSTEDASVSFCIVLSYYPFASLLPRHKIQKETSGNNHCLYRRSRAIQRWIVCAWYSGSCIYSIDSFREFVWLVTCCRSFPRVPTSYIEALYFVFKTKFLAGFSGFLSIELLLCFFI